MDYYSSVDLHVGYRVHAHIFMNSISKLSILLSEDGRGKSVRNVIGGIIIDAYESFKDDIFSKKLYQLMKYDRFQPNANTTNEIINSLEYEMKTDFHRLKCSRKNIDQNYTIMKKFLLQLP